MTGCNERFPPEEMQNHEAKCLYKSQYYFFCSFSGNLTQIINHASKCHPGNITVDGKIEFSLSKAEYKKTVLYLLNNTLYVIIFEITEELVKVFIQIENQNFEANQFAVKFFNVKDLSNCSYVSTDYGMLYENFPNYFEKAKDHLKLTFGPDATLSCQILVAEFDSNAKEFEILQRYAILRGEEKKLAEIQYKNKSYNTAIKIIKLMSYAFFKCDTCNINCAPDLYFCQNIHFYCRLCLKKYCKQCRVAREYKNLKDLNFEVACEYEDCNKRVKIMQYLAHKIECSKRTYKCPLENCNEIIISAQSLIQHWHANIPKLRNQKTFVLKEYRAEEFFWLIENDLYQVLVDFAEDKIRVLIDGVNVLNNRVVFKYDLGDSVFRKFNYKMSIFCGSKWEAREVHDNKYRRLRIKYSDTMIAT